MGHDQLTELLAAWARIREERGRRATVLDLYRMVAEPRGLQPWELPLEERLVLARAAAPVIWPGFESTDDSERRDRIEIVPYRDEWPARFEALRARIADALGPVAQRIEHGGATSVPGLAAKPVIDVQVTVLDLEDEARYVPALGAVGIQLRSRDVLHRFLRPFPDQPRTFHVHVSEVGSDWEREHLLFRDFLRSHPDDAQRYAAAKLAAVEHWADDGWGYTDAKTEVVLDLLDEAEAWAAHVGWTP